MRKSLAHFLQHAYFLQCDTMAGVFQVSDNDQSVQRECPHRGQGKAVPGKNRRTDIHFECTDTDTQNKQKKKPNPTTSGSSETWPHVSWGARPHSSAQFRLTTWCYCRGWDRCTLVVIAHPFQSGLANMMRSENAIFKKKKMTGRLFCRDRGRTDGLIIEEEEERRGRRTIRFRKHFIKK